MDSRGTEILDPVDVANKFCNYFSTVACKLDSDIPTIQTDPMSYMPEPISDSFSASLVTTEEVIQVLSSLQNKPAHVNNIPIFVFKKFSIHSSCHMQYI